MTDYATRSRMSTAVLSLISCHCFRLLHRTSTFPLTFVPQLSSWTLLYAHLHLPCYYGVWSVMTLVTKGPKDHNPHFLRHDNLRPHNFLIFPSSLLLDAQSSFPTMRFFKSKRTSLTWPRFITFPFQYVIKLYKSSTCEPWEPCGNAYYVTWATLSRLLTNFTAVSIELLNSLEYRWFPAVRGISTIVFLACGSTHTRPFSVVFENPCMHLVAWDGGGGICSLYW